MKVDVSSVITPVADEDLEHSYKKVVVHVHTHQWYKNNINESRECQ